VIEFDDTTTGVVAVRGTERSVNFAGVTVFGYAIRLDSVELL